MILFPAKYIGAGVFAAAVESFAAQGLLDEMLVIADERLAAAAPVRLPYCMIDEMSDPEGLAEKAASFLTAHSERCTGVLGIDDEDGFIVARTLRRHFGVAAPSPQSFDYSSNKWQMKERFTLAGVPTPAYCLVDAALCGLEAFGLPSVLKPLRGSGSEYLALVSDVSGARGLFAAHAQYVRAQADRLAAGPIAVGGEAVPLERFMLAERPARGTEFSLDFLVDHERLEIVRVSRKIPGGHFGYFGGFHLLPGRVWGRHGLDAQRLQELCRGIARALEVRLGVCMVDFFLDGQEVQVIESSLRPGLAEFVPLMSRLCGQTSLSLYAALLHGRKPAPPVMRHAGVALNYSAPRAGRVRSLVLEAGDKLPAEIKRLWVYPLAQAGTELADSDFDHHDLLVGRVLAEVEAGLDTAAAAACVKGWVRFSVDLD